jgi:hypothetical protein
MKLGEALSLRADIQKRMNRVQALLSDNATVQEGDRPAVDPTDLLAEYRGLAAEHEMIVRRINRTNLGARIELGAESLTLADAVIRRERLAREAGVLREMANRAIPKASRFLRTELKHVPTIDIGGTIAEADRLSKEHRELDARIQQANWEVELSD